MQYDGTSTTNFTDPGPLTLDKLRKLIEQIPDYALLTAQPVVTGDECLMMRKNEWMPPGCRYLLIVAPDRLHAVAKRFGARVSSRIGDGNFYEFCVPKPPKSEHFGLLTPIDSIT